MAVYDRWHKRTPDRDADGNPVTCEHRKTGEALYPSADHGCAKRWQVRWDDPHAAARGQRKRNFAKKDGKNANLHADAFDKQVQGELVRGAYRDPTAGDITLEEWARKWRALKSVGLLTQEKIDSGLKVHIYGKPIRHHSMRRLADKPGLVQEWIIGMEEDGLKPSTIDTIAKMLSAIFIAAMEEGVVTNNPMRSSIVKVPAGDDSDVEVWDRGMVTAAQKAMPARYRAMVDLAVGAGHRQGEVFAIARGDISEGEIRVVRQVKVIGGSTLVFDLPKARKTRTVPLSAPLAARLATHLEEHGTTRVTLPWRTPDGEPHTADLLFATEQGRPLHRTDFNEQVWHPARAAAGAPASREHGFHVLRHTAASAWLSSGIDILKVAAWLGHKDPAFTLRTYIHHMRGSMAAARKVMGTFFNEDNGGGDPPETPSGSAPDVPPEGSG